MLTVSDIERILINEYSLSDLEFVLGVTIKDFSEGLETFIAEYEDDILLMFKQDSDEEEY